METKTIAILVVSATAVDRCTKDKRKTLKG